MIIVTGGGGGIGAAVARRLGATSPICVNYLTNARGANEVVDVIRDGGGRAIAVQADVGSENEIEALFRQAGEQLGPVRGVVNNAGDTGGTARVDTVTAGGLDLAYRSSLRSVILMTKHAARAMSTERGGRGGFIINIASTAARTGGAWEWVHYAAMKAAVLAHTRGAATELAPEGIRVNAVSPGLVQSPLHERNGMPDRPDRLRTSIPAGRLGRPDDIAAAVEFLATADAGYVAGANLEVCGAR